jgi:predicted transport protein
MPLFEITKQELSTVEQSNFSSEKELQSIVEKNLKVIFNCRLVASEFPTGPQHAGRIDTLALSEEHNPVIIEYKKVESSELINQSLFYLAWIQDHRGDFEIAVQKTLGSKIKIDWTDIRVICIAPNYRKYDLYAAQVMGANIELWTYRLFKNNHIYFEEVFQKSYSADGTSPTLTKQLTPGKKAAITRKTGIYSFKQHIKNKQDDIIEIATAVQEFMMDLDPAMEEVPKKFYVAYRISQNIVCMEVKKHKIILYLKLDPKTVSAPKDIFRDVTDIGHYGTGDLEVSIKSMKDFEITKPFLMMTYQKLGG